MRLHGTLGQVRRQAARAVVEEVRYRPVPALPADWLPQHRETQEVNMAGNAVGPLRSVLPIQHEGSRGVECAGGWPGQVYPVVYRNLRAVKDCYAARRRICNL